MPYHQDIDPLASPDPKVEQVSRDQGDTEILADNLEEEMQNISFDELQRRVVKSCKVSTPDEHTSPVPFEERVIVFDMHKHPSVLANATRPYAEATSSSVRFLIPENEKMAKDL